MYVISFNFHLRPFIEGLHCRVGTVGPIALRWVSGVEVQCVATAQPSRRAAPVAVLTSISMAGAYTRPHLCST